MNKFYINGKFFSQPVTGTQRYARELLNQFDRLLSEERYRELTIEVLVPRSAYAIPLYAHLQVRPVGNSGGVIWEQAELPWHARRHTLLTLSGGAPLLHSRNVVTIHDASVFAAPEGYSWAYRFWYRMLYRRLATSAKRILTVSEFSAAEIIRWCGASPERIAVTYPGSEHFQTIAADVDALRRFGIFGRYVLTASSNKPNKNFGRTIAALHQLKQAGIELVIAGGQDTKVYGHPQALPDGARSLGYVTDEELKALYDGAACFIFASLYEGFGLPPLEALSCGCPIVVANVSSLPEVFAGIATFCNPYSPEDIAKAVEETLQSPVATPEEMKQFARGFSWDKCARQTLDILLGLDSIN